MPQAAQRREPDTDMIAEAIKPALNGTAHDVIAGQTGDAPAIATVASGAVTRAAEEACDQIQATVDHLLDLQAKLKAEAGDLSSNIRSFTAMAASIASAFKDYQREGARRQSGD